MCNGNHDYVRQVTNDGEVYTWGKGSNGRLGHDDTKSQLLPVAVSALKGIKIVSITCGHNFTTAVSDLGHVYCWGRGDQGQVSRVELCIFQY